MSDKNQIGLIGLGTMGSNLARNFARNKIKTAVFNRTYATTQNFLNEFETELNLEGFEHIIDFINSLEKPRKIILMVTAGKATDAVIETLKPHLDPQDIIIDGGNSHFKDTIARAKKLLESKIIFIGCGISGGEQGALYGPSIMLGGETENLKQLVPYFQKIAALDFHKQPCVAEFIGSGAGNFVKTVHNGIEYAIMQILADVYEILRSGYNLSATQIASIFSSYKNSDIDGFLLETVIQVLNKPDTFHKNESLIDYIADQAGAKGTGGWTVASALEYGVPIPTITTALFARQLSANIEMRQQYSLETLPTLKVNLNNLPKISQEFKAHLYNVIKIGMIFAYQQGIELIEKAALEEKWQIDPNHYLRVWQGGCIIRSNILKVLPVNPNSDFFQEIIHNSLQSLQQIMLFTSKALIPVPAITSTFNYLLYLSNDKLPTNLIQGMRDCFGAHQYFRTDQSGLFTEKWH